jgi:hypothetical protein
LQFGCLRAARYSPIVCSIPLPQDCLELLHGLDACESVLLATVRPCLSVGLLVQILLIICPVILALGIVIRTPLAFALGPRLVFGGTDCFFFFFRGRGKAVDNALSLAAIGIGRFAITVRSFVVCLAALALTLARCVSLANFLRA